MMTKPELKNDRLLRALSRQEVDVTPVWMMRQAGRYLPEYRATRAKAGSFMNLCMNPELACEVTLQPLARYPLDAAILFSDILTIPDAMGLGLYFAEGEGPKFKSPVRKAEDIERLEVIDPATDLPYVLDAVSLIRRELNGRVPLIGFSGSPWTLATYMVEGESSRDFARVKALAFDFPELMHQLLAKLADSIILYLNAQIERGAQAVQLFDTWGGMLSHNAYREFSLSYMERILQGLHKEYDGRKVPSIVFTKAGGQWLDAIAASGCDCVGLDWTMDIAEAKRKVGLKVALQGNMDPAVLRAQPERVRQEVAAILAGFGKGAGHVFNLGHGITPDIEPDRVTEFVNCVHELSVTYHT